MPTRREVLGGGLAAVLMGGLARKAAGADQLANLCARLPFRPWKPTDPLGRVPIAPDSVIIDGLPFARGFTGDDFPDDEIPFHFSTDWFAGKGPPVPDEHVKVAVVGGGLSGLCAAYLLREHDPVIFELRDRMGGNCIGEIWNNIPYSLGSAYFITPDSGSFLDNLYRELGLHRVVRVSLPPDPVEIQGKIDEAFWSGAARPPEEQLAFQRYAEVVTYMAEKAYPDIPLSDDPDEIARIHALDRKNFREDIEGQMGMPMPPLLAAAVQAYFYSSFGAPMEEISAASGWNFVAAEEYGRWVLPGGNAYFARALWKKLAERHQDRPPLCRPVPVRCKCQVVDVRLAGPKVQVSYFDPERRLRSMLADFVIMAGSKHITKYVLHDLHKWDPEKRAACNEIWNAAYAVVNVLLEAPIKRDFYDCFLVGDKSFPMDGNAFEANSIVVDMLRGDFALPGRADASVLSLFWPLPWPSARFTLLLGDAYREYAMRLAPQLREMLALLEVPESAVQQVRMSRWGHAMPLARPNLIADGVCELVRRPLDNRVYFVNQDNWSLPAVENSLLEAQTVAAAIQSRV